MRALTALPSPALFHTPRSKAKKHTLFVYKYNTIKLSSILCSQKENPYKSKVFKKPFNINHGRDEIPQINKKRKGQKSKPENTMVKLI